MSVNKEYVEKRLVDGDERDRMRQRTSDVLDYSSASSYYSESQDILPLRPGVSKHNHKNTRVYAPISTQHKERGLHRSDEWVGGQKKKNRKSWKVKAVRDVKLDDATDAQSVQSVPVDFGRREPLLFSKPNSKQDEKAIVPAVVLSQKPKALDSSSVHSILTEDSMWSRVSENDWIQGSKEMKESTSSLFGGTDKLVASKYTTSDKKDLDGCASSLLSDSSIHSSATRDPMRKWQSTSAGSSNFTFLDSSPEKPKTIPIWKPKPARTLPITDVQKEKESTPAPTKSAAKHLTTPDDTYCLPDLEISSHDSSSTEKLDFLTTKSPSSFRWKNKKHWRSMAGSKRYQRPSNSNYQTDGDQEAQRRRSDIRDSLLKSALDAPYVF